MKETKDKQLDVDFLLLEKYLNSKDYESIVDYAYKHFHEEWNKVGLKRCTMPNNGESLELISENGEKYIAPIPNRASARSAGTLYLMALCKVAGKDYDQLKSRSHKKYAGKNKQEISASMDSHLDDLRLLQVSLGAKSVIGTMAHIRPRWMSLSDEEKSKYFDQILEVATESVLAGHDRAKTIRDIYEKITDINISRQTLQNYLDEYGIDEDDIYYVSEKQQGIVIDKDQATVLKESIVDIARNSEIQSSYHKPQGTYEVLQEEDKIQQDGSKVTQSRILDIKFHDE